MHRKAKAVLVGDSGVGKSCIFAQYESGAFTTDAPPTVGGAYTTIKTKLQNGDIIDIGLWDTAGQERFRNVVPMYFERTNFVLIVFSLTEESSFQHCSEWVKLAEDKAAPGTKLILVGNKNDLVDQRKITTEELLEYGESIGAILAIETSAKTGVGLDALVHEMAKSMVEEVNEPEAGVILEAHTEKKAKRKACCK